MQVWKFKIVNADPSYDRITLKQTFLRYSVNCGMLALLGMPLFLIYADSKKLAVNDILSKTRLEKSLTRFSEIYKFRFLLKS